jgi:tyrosyl-tRNA synthetase
MTNFLQIFQERGYLHQCTNLSELSQRIESGPIAAYIGFDCTAKSLHVGNLMQVMILRLLQQCGHKPIVLIGGATTKIGDPTGKDEVRKYLTDAEIEENIAGIKKSLAKFITFGDGPTDAIMVNNATWLEELGYIEFLRDMGRMFSVNRMLTMDSVKIRLEREQALTFLEFNYMLLQAYDFYHLNKEFSCLLQLGGSDQWGNIVMGVDLVRKCLGSEGFGLTTPLLTTASGVKMGKSVSGAVWLNEEQLSSYEYFQYWRNTEDADVIKFAKLYCEFSDTELESFISVAKENINEAKKRLAYKVTQLCHGKEQADEALETAINLFEKGVAGGNLPSFEIKTEELAAGINICELLMQCGLASSKSEAKRLIRGGGARINDVQITDENLSANSAHLIDGAIKLSSGKKNHILIKLRD